MFTEIYLMTVIVSVTFTLHTHIQTPFPPSVFGLGGVGPGAGGSDVRVWNVAVLHPQGVPTVSCEGNIGRSREDRRRIKL